VSVHEEQSGGFAEVTQRRNSAEQDSAVAAVEDREAVLLQRCAHACVEGVHHFQQSALVHEPRQIPAAWIGLGHHDV
jgi:hypothetical protein